MRTDGEEERECDALAPTIHNTQQHTCSMGQYVLQANCASPTPNIKLGSCGLQTQPVISRWTQTSPRHVLQVERGGLFGQNPNTHSNLQ
ncbi:uncharacterized protein V6R79_023270 [Siganus canaliculatus]